MSNIPDNIKKMWEEAAKPQTKQANPYTPPQAGRGRGIGGPKPEKKLPPGFTFRKGSTPHSDK